MRPSRMLRKARNSLRKGPRRIRYRLGGEHLLITGTGRAGTTLLVRIMTNLGLDTGYKRDDASDVEKNTGRAGLEHEISERTAPTLPAIVKSPLATDILHEALKCGWLRLWHVIVPVRDLAAAADSRRRAQIRAEERGLAANMAPGGLWITEDPAAQEQALAIQLYKAIDALTLHEVPLTLISFPRFVNDQDYFIRQIGPLLERGYGVSETELRRAHREECRPEFIGELPA